jgi:two-component system phosphate regulon sensor histidine kinase PhoR
MSRTVLILLTIFLSLAMIALVGIQAFWFRSSIEAKEKQLGLVVNQVLGEISGELARNETTMAILDEIRPPVVTPRSQAVWNFHFDDRSTGAPEIAGDSAEKEAENIEVDEPEWALEEMSVTHEGNDIQITLDIPHVGESHISGEVSFLEDSILPGELHKGRDALLFTAPDHSIKNRQIKMIDDTVMVILGEDESLRDTILVSAMNPEQVKAELMRSWKEQELFVDRIVRRMLMEATGIEDLVTSGQVEKLLTARLAEKGVDMPFEYAIYEKGKDPVYASSNFSESEQVRYYRAPLLPGGLFGKPTLISIYFPQERRHFVKSMGIMGGTSALITLLVLTLFSLALFIIFKQKRLSEMKNDFVNNMTHELKTPISTISLASQMLNDKSIPEEQKNLNQIARIIQTESRQLGFQVERVLQMAIFDHGELKLKLEELDLHQVIETVAQNFLLQLDKRGGRLDFSPDAEYTVIHGDSMHITNVISNLLENAVKYTRQNPQIGISTHNEQDNIVVSVSDNGIGISKEDQKRIFDKFFRVPTGNVHNVKGFGLGLSYVKLIVEHHRGSIKIKSEPGKGSKFDIILPLYKASSI